MEEREGQLELAAEVDYDIEPEEAGPLKPYPYQLIGADFLRRSKNALLADDMGIGKTVQALLALKGEPSLIVCPPSVAFQWEREAQRWRPDYPVNVAYEKLTAWPKGKQIIVLPRSRIPTHPVIKEERERKKSKVPDFPGTKRPVVMPYWQDISDHTTIVIDEVHEYKDPKAQRTIDLRLIAKACNKRIGLTGTPIISYALDYWAILELLELNSVAFPGGMTQFGRLYGRTLEAVRKKGSLKESKVWLWGTPDPDPDFQREREAAFKRVALRRTKEEVAPWLPKKRREFIPVAVDSDVEQEVEACLFGNAFTKERIERAMKNPSGMDFRTLSISRALLAADKLSHALEIAESFEEAKEPLIVFSAHLAVTEALGTRLGWARIDGTVPVTRRPAIVDAFQDGYLKGLAVNIKAGGVGLNLTRSHNILFVDRDWSPELNRQCEDRAYRIGQNKPVRVMILVANHPIDRRIEEVLTEKEALIRATFIDAGKESP